MREAKGVAYLMRTELTQAGQRDLHGIVWAALSGRGGTNETLENLDILPCAFGAQHDHALDDLTSTRIDNFLSVLIPYVGLSFAWSIFLVKSFLEDFPAEVVEASRIDGAGPIQTFWYVVLPNSLSSVFATGILQFLWTWNALLLPLLYLRTNVPLPVILARVNGTYELNWDLQSVAAIVTTVVPLVVFLIFQRQFAAGAETRTGAKD